MKRPMPKISVDMLYYAPLLTDTAAEGETPASLTFGTPKRIPGTVGVGFNPNSTNAPFYADGGIYTSAVQLGDLALSLTQADIPPEIQAEWFGLDYADGVIEQGQINPIEMAVGYRVRRADGGYRYFWFLKCKAAPPAENAETSTGSINFQTDSITIIAALTTATGTFRRFVDDNDENLPADTTAAAIEANWFTDPLWDINEVVI